MFKGPNIELLGEALSQAIRNAPNYSTSLPEKSYSPLFTLQTGRDNKKAHLFCVPGAGGNVASFIELVSSLDNQWPIYGLQPRGLDGELVPHSTVSAASQSYLRIIEEICPKASIHLLGHSFGGWVAFDMAQQLLENGRQVSSLIILDSEAPDDQLTPVREFIPAEVVMEMLDAYEQVVGHSLGIDRGDLDVCSETEQLELLHGRLVVEGLLPSRSEPDVLYGPLRTFATSLRTHYHPTGIFPGPVQLILADDAKLDQNTNLQNHKRVEEGWRRWAPNLVCTHAPGNHMTMLKQPYVNDIVQFFNLGKSLLSG